MKILLIDPHTLFREGLRHILRQLPGGVDEILEVDNFPDGFRVAGQHSDLDLVLLELASPGSEGAFSVRLFRQRYPRIPLVLLSGDEDYRATHKVPSYGASGFVCKSSSGAKLLNVISSALAGGIHVPQFLQQHDMPAANQNDRNGNSGSNANEYGLTTRQMLVLGYLTAGLSNKTIAATINLAEGTVKAHVSAIYQALRVNNRIDAMRVANRLGLTGHVADGGMPLNF